LARLKQLEEPVRVMEQTRRQLDGIAKAKESGVRFGVQPKLTETIVKEISEASAL